MERTAAARRFGPVAVFALVLAVLVAIAARPGGGGSDRDLTPIPLGARGALANEGAPHDAAGGSSTRAMYYGGEIVVPDRLLDGVPTEGPVHDVTAGDTSGGRITALAKALGVSGEVRTDAEGWVVGDGDTVLRVLRQPGSPWYLGPDKFGVRPVDGGVVVAEPATPQPAPAPKPDEDPDGDTPVSSDPCAPDSPTCSSGTAPKALPCPTPTDGTEPACVPPAPPPEPTKPPQPTDAEARAVAQRVFDAAGLGGAGITVNDAWDGKEVVAAPVVGGLPTVGFETRVTVELGGDILWASGFLGGTDAKGDYPLLAPREAVARGGAWGGVRDLALGAPCPPEEPCPTPEPREATALRLGLMYMTSYDAAQGAFLAPAWLLTFEGNTWEEPVLALPDRYIATPSPAPGDEPGVQTDPGTGTEPSGGAGSDGSAGSGEVPPETGTTVEDTAAPE